MKKPEEVIKECIAILEQLAQEEANAPTYVVTAKTPSEAYRRAIETLRRIIARA